MQLCPHEAYLGRFVQFRGLLGFRRGKNSKGIFTLAEPCIKRRGRERAVEGANNF